MVNKIGSVRIDTLKKGEYVLGRRDFTAGIRGSSNSETISFAYPNPNSGVFRVELPRGKWSVELLNLNGKRIGNWSVFGKQEINVSHLAKGQYIVRATSEDQQLTQAMVIQ